jgi:hypothetical protein
VIFFTIKSIAVNFLTLPCICAHGQRSGDEVRRSKANGLPSD